MTILALEFSSDRRSVAVVKSDHQAVRGEDQGGRSTRAFLLIDQVLREAEVTREAVNTIVVGLGPGSYTGIRVAISIGQGWHLARGPKLIGLSTADCLAEQARTSGVRGPLHIAIDAQRGEFYHTSYVLTDAGRQSVVALRLTTRDEIIRQVGGEPLWCDPGLVKEFPGAQAGYPDAAILGRLALEGMKSAAGSDAELQPIYLREVSFVKAAPPRRVILD